MSDSVTMEVSITEKLSGKVTLGVYGVKVLKAIK